MFILYTNYYESLQIIFPEEKICVSYGSNKKGGENLSPPRECRADSGTSQPEPTWKDRSVK
jgi:hypothetical protein